VVAIAVAELKELCLHVPPPSTGPAITSLSSTFKAAEDAKAVQINAEGPAKTFQIGAGLNPKYGGELIDFERCNKDNFAWSPTEMLGVPQEVIEHTLNIKPDSKTVK
jgi:hypothetical protein